MLPIPRSGALVDVAGIDAASAVDGIAGLEITARRGRPIEAIPEGGRYLGFLFARGDTPAQVEASLRQAHARLEINIVDEPDAVVAGQDGPDAVPDPSLSVTEIMLTGRSSRT